MKLLPAHKTGAALLLVAALLCASCEEALQDYLNELRDFTFTAEAITAEAAVKDAPAGSFDAEGGAEPLIYKLVSGEGDGEFFRVEGARLFINRDSLDEGDYTFRARVEDQEGRLLQGDFTLTVYGEGEGPGGPEDPEDPGDPTDPGDPGDIPQKPARATNFSSSPGMGWVLLRWAASARAESYEVYYGTGSAFANAAKWAEEPTEPQVTVTGLADGTAYNFWVVVKNRGGAAAESRMYKAEKTSDPLPAGFLYRGAEPSVFQATNIQGGDGYQFRDLGADKAPDERYAFDYVSSTVQPLQAPRGTIKFVRRFAEYPADGVGGYPSSGGYNTSRDDYLWDNNRGVIIYELEQNGSKEYWGVYWIDYREAFPPQAIMGTANGYRSHGGSFYRGATLEEAVAALAHIRLPGGRDYWFAMMGIVYRLIGNP